MVFAGTSTGDLLSTPPSTRSVVSFLATPEFAGITGWRRSISRGYISVLYKHLSLDPKHLHSLKQLLRYFRLFNCLRVSFMPFNISTSLHIALQTSGLFAKTKNKLHNRAAVVSRPAKKRVRSSSRSICLSWVSLLSSCRKLYRPLGSFAVFERYGCSSMRSDLRNSMALLTCPSIKS